MISIYIISFIVFFGNLKIKLSLFFNDLWILGLVTFNIANEFIFTML